MFSPLMLQGMLVGQQQAQAVVLDGHFLEMLSEQMTSSEVQMLKISSSMQVELKE